MTGEPPPPELNALVPIPTDRGSPATEPRDIFGLDASGAPRHVEVRNAARWSLLLFLSSHCDGCRPFWSAPRAFWDGALGEGVAVDIVTKGPEHEDPRALPAAPGGVGLVMSSAAWADYRVSGPPFFVLVDGGSGRVITEGVAWGLEATADWARRGRLGRPREPDMVNLAPPDAVR